MVGGNFSYTYAKMVASVAAFSKVFPYFLPGFGVVDDVAVHVDVKDSLGGSPFL